MMCNFYLLVVVVIATNSCCQAWKVQDFDDGNSTDKDEVYGVVIQLWKIIFPRTKWCGTGNIAENENDLGSPEELDICCRAHDYCNDIIEGGQTKHNLINKSFYTKLNCECDDQFNDCLKRSSRIRSKIVGHLYFNVLGSKCFRNDYPIVGCIKYHSFITSRCIEYGYDMNAPSVWQWFDVRPFEIFH